MFLLWQERMQAMLVVSIGFSLWGVSEAGVNSVVCVLFENCTVDASIFVVSV